MCTHKRSRDITEANYPVEMKAFANVALTQLSFILKTIKLAFYILDPFSNFIHSLIIVSKVELINDTM